MVIINPTPPPVYNYAAQTTRYTSTPLGMGSVASTVSSLRSQCYSGAPVIAANVRSLVDLYNTFIYHYHWAEDLIGMDTFGNVSYYGSGYYTTQYTDAPINISHPAYGYPANTYDGYPIYASEFNTIISIINSTRYHYHNINDS